MIKVEQTDNGIWLQDEDQYLFLSNVELEKMLAERINLAYFHRKEELESEVRLWKHSQSTL